MFAPNCVVALSAPEICLKSDYVKQFMEKLLRDNAKLSLKNSEVSIKGVQLLANRMFFATAEPAKVAEVLSKVFGFHSIALEQQVQFQNLEELEVLAPQLCKGKLKNTFAVRGKSYSNEIKSKKLEELLGGAILSAQPELKVNLTTPKTEVHCIVFEKKAFFWFDFLSSAKGMPVGSQGLAALLCGSASKKDDSALAWLLLRAGCRVILAGNDLKAKDFVKLKEFNNFEEVHIISTEEAKKRFKEGRIKAFFCSAITPKSAENASELVGTKVFAPLLLVKAVTPFD